MLCTRQYSFHCPSTLVLPRKVKRWSRLLDRRLPNTGSTVAKRRAIISRPWSVLIDLEQHPRVVGRRAFVLVLVARLDLAQIELVLDQMVKGVIEAAGVELLGEVNSQKMQAVIDRFEARHHAPAHTAKQERKGVLLQPQPRSSAGDNSPLRRLLPLRWNCLFGTSFPPTYAARSRNSTFTASKGNSMRPSAARVSTPAFRRAVTSP